VFSHNVGVYNLTNENGMRAHVHLFGDSGFQVRNSIIDDYRSARLTYLVFNPIKFVAIPTRFKAKAANKVEGVSSQRTEAAKTLLSLMNSWVRLLLLMLTAIVGGSEVTWNTVLAI
jgi:hypothetical protein